MFTDVQYVVPQGSVLGTLLLSLYISPLGQIIQSYGIHFHCCANKTQLDENENHKIRELLVCGEEMDVRKLPATECW